MSQKERKEMDVTKTKDGGRSRDQNQAVDVVGIQPTLMSSVCPSRLTY